ncbi:MAG: orotidine-5'-phosphate decarboxylase [Gammaproteobacteria bacterium]|nr:MAG: orotidine-5'-phosphate decarboxylase [Gammaproteobacteria bacterium]RLA15896.1 MAG: orotidine-5'-phosphate decarboxylase [Gammaproteobacteria bacterium]RLA17524.1 MAG: orotidine-5'-phosphate decarboxylase [Gammaproteobacteria bacterium]
MSDQRLIVAMDFASLDAALRLAEKIQPESCRLKVGHQLYTAAGPDAVRRLTDMGFEIFLDLKYHDIPNTVANACRAAADLGVWMVNVHAAGGPAMLEAAVAAVGSSGPRVIGVTILTSIDARQYEQIGYQGELADQVTKFAVLAQSSGLDGVVCSAQEARALRSRLGEDFLLVTPGIRPNGADLGDQQRVMTPAAAVAAGSDYLVIGRPITQAKDPRQVIQTIQGELELP